jgi:hypothetical protein
MPIRPNAALFGAKSVYTELLLDSASIKPTRVTAVFSKLYSGLVVINSPIELPVPTGYSIGTGAGTSLLQEARVMPMKKAITATGHVFLSNLLIYM